MVFKICVVSTDCISEINNTQTENAKDIDAVIPMYTLVEYNDNYSKTSGGLWQHYRDEPVLTDAGPADNFLSDSASFKFKQKVTGTAGAGCTKNVKIMVPLKYFSNV